MSSPPHAGLDHLLSELLGRSGQVPIPVLQACAALGISERVTLGEALLAGGHLGLAELERAYAQLPASSSGPLHLGEVVAGRYRVEGLLGQGGMGAVYRVLELQSRRSLALKVILPSSAEELDLLRFEREGQVAARLSRAQGFVRVHSGGHHRGLPYFVMDLVEGQDLESRLRAGLDAEGLARVLVSVAEALHVGHQEGLIHRDLKPANVLIGPEGPKVADLGLVRDRDAQTLTQTGEILGTPAYMAPEQIEDARGVDARTDVYALGAILYRGLAGRPPFVGPWIHVLSRVVSEPPPLPSEVTKGAPSPFEGICLRAMAKDPDERYPDAQSFADDLRRVLAGEEALGSASRSGGRLLRVALVASAVLLALAGGWLASQRGELGLADATPRDTRAERARARAERARARALEALEDGYAGLLSEHRAVASHALLEQSARVVKRAEESGISLDEIRAAKRRRWASSRSAWSHSLASAAADRGGDPAGVLSRLRAILLARPELRDGVARVSSRAMEHLLASESERDYRRAVDLHTEEIPFGVSPPRLLQERAYERFKTDASLYVDCLRLGVPVQFGTSHFRVRQLVKLHPRNVRPGQLGAFLEIALQLGRDWPRGSSEVARDRLRTLSKDLQRALAQDQDLGHRYVQEMRYLEFRARTSLVEWTEPPKVEADLEFQRRLRDLAREGASLRSESTSVLVYELAEIEDRLWNVVGELERAREVWEGAIAQLEAEVRAAPIQDCPELYLGRSYRGLAYSYLRLRRPRECLKHLERSLAELTRIGPALTKIGAEVGFFEVRFRTKAAGIGARAYLELNQPQEAERVLEPYLNLQTARRNHNLAEVAIHVAIARKDRPAALARLERFQQLPGEDERYRHLRAVFERAFAGE